MKMNVVLLRVSTDMQDFDAQKLAIDKYVKENNIVVHKTIEEKGISGFKTKLEDRLGLQELINMALNEELAKVIVFNQDRIGRRVDLLPFISTMNEEGVEIHSVTEGGIINNDNESSELLQIIKLWTASYESKKTSLRVQNGLKVAVVNNNGYTGGVVNFGYKLDDKKMIINEEEAEIVKLIFDRYINYGTQKTVDYLNENNILKRGELWTKSKLFGVIYNNIYRGYKEYRDELIEIPSIRIVSDEVFNKAQERAKSRNVKGTNRYTNKTDALFEGLIFHKCPDDNKERKLHIDYVNTKAGKVHTYRCRHCRDTKAKVTKNFNSTKIEPLIIDNIKSIMNNISIETLEKRYKDIITKDTGIITNSINNINDSIAKKNKAIDNAMKLIEKILLEESTMDINIPNDMIINLRAEIKELEEQLEIKQNELNELTNKTSNVLYLVDKYKDFEYLFDNSDNIKKKAILQELIDSIVIENGDINIKLNLY